MEEKLYKGKVVLKFDEKRHIYSVKGKKVYGVTSIVGVLDKPGLKFWAVDMAIEALEKKLLPGKTYDEMEIKWMLDAAKAAHTKRLKKAGDVGTAVHDWLSMYITAGIAKKTLPKLPTNKEMRQCLKGFFRWVKENKVKFIASEQKCYSRKHGYAGTYDAEAIVNGKKTIIDFKTGKKIYPEMILQATAYLVAKEEDTKKKYTGGVIILRLSKEIKEKKVEAFESRIVPRKELTNGLFDVFISCLNIYKWKMALKREWLRKNIGK